MLRSIHHAHLALRIGLALVFLWFGIDRFIQSQFLSGIFEVAVAVSVASGFFIRWFAASAVIFLAVMVRDLGLVGGLVALVIWPERSYI